MRRKNYFPVRKDEGEGRAYATEFQLLENSLRKKNLSDRERTCYLRVDQEGGGRGEGGGGVIKPDIAASRAKTPPIKPIWRTGIRTVFVRFQQNVVQDRLFRMDALKSLKQKEFCYAFPCAMLIKCRCEIYIFNSA